MIQNRYTDIPQQWIGILGSQLDSHLLGSSRASFGRVSTCSCMYNVGSLRAEESILMVPSVTLSRHHPSIPSIQVTKVPTTSLVLG